MGILEHFKECKTLLDYLKTLSVHVVDELFGFPAPCLAIFRYVDESTLVISIRPRRNEDSLLY
jgi:hypothetical protein